MECETKPTPQCLLSGCQPKYAPIKLTTCLVLYLFSSSVRKVPQSEQNVLDKTRGPVAQMAAKSLHTTSLEGEVGGSQNKLSLLHIVKDPWNKPHGLPNALSSRQERSSSSYLHNLWFVAGTDRQHFQNSTAGPEQLLVGVQSHDTHQQCRPPTG